MRQLTILLFALAAIGCGEKHDDHDHAAEEKAGIKGIAWLEGQWIQQDSAGMFLEHWMTHGDKMHGQGSMITGKDTMMSEKLSITTDTAGLTYTVRFPDRTVNFVSKGQTNTKELNNLSYNESDEITFVNDTNDFPREIVYRKQNSDSLYITLRGSEGGKPMEMVLKMKKQ